MHHIKQREAQQLCNDKVSLRAINDSTLERAINDLSQTVAAIELEIGGLYHRAVPGNMVPAGEDGPASDTYTGRVALINTAANRILGRLREVAEHV